MKTTFTLAAAVVAMTAVGGWLAPSSAFAQSQSGCDSANTTVEEETVVTQGSSGKPAKNTNNQGTTTTTIEEEQAAPKKCPPEVTEEVTDRPGRNK